MAQCEQTTLYFRMDDEKNYIDLAAAVTAANRKQFHQVTRSGHPNCYLIRVSAIKGNLNFWTLQNQFATCNSVKQTCAGWKAQLKHASIKLKDLPPYGRRARFALETDAYLKDVNALFPDHEIYTLSKLHLQPLMSPGGDPFFGIYTSTDNKTVRYQATNVGVAGTLSPNMITQVTVTDGAGTESQDVLVMVGDDVAGEFNVINNYMEARRQTPDVSIDTPGPSADSEMLNLFSVAEEMSDDIVEGVSEYMDWKPYTTDTAPNAKFDHLTLGAEVSNITSASTQYPPNSGDIPVPLGLLRVTGDADDDFRVDVLAIYEM